MNKPKIFLTRALPPDVMTYLEEHADLSYNKENRVLNKEELLEGVKGQDGLLCLLTDGIDQDVLEANPDLKVVSNYAVGFNNIDVATATSQNIPVTNTPGVLSDSSADLAFALMLAISRRVVEADRYLRKGGWEGWGPLQFLGTDFSGSTLGIIGLGRIGKAMVRRAKGFDMEILYWNRTRLPLESEAQLGVQYRPFDELLSQSDFVSLHVAYQEETHHLIDEQALKYMKTTGYLVNTSRGPVVKEQALIEALQKNYIAGAGLDVFEHEPLVPEALIALDNVVLIPHLASATLATRTKMGMMAAQDCVASCMGKRPVYLVNTSLDTPGRFL